MNLGSNVKKIAFYTESSVGHTLASRDNKKLAQNKIF